MPKSNLIVFLTDQQRTDTIACYGNEKIHAPFLAKLASESVVVERAYVTQPLCVPSRASLMTGMWPHANGCTRNGLALAPHYLTLPELIDGDYRTGYFGKWQLGDETQRQHGFDEWASTEGASDYSRFLMARGYNPDGSNGGFSDRAVSNLPLEVCKPSFLQDHACSFIRSHRRDRFILFVSYVEPHSPYNGPLNNEHPLSEVDLDATALTAATENIPLRYRLMREWQQREAILDRKRLPTLYYFGITPEEYRAMKQRYYGLVTMVDRSIGAILNCIASAGLWDNTVMVHTSDHGDMLGAHHLFGKEVMFEEATRVPYLVRMPGQQRQSRVREPISHIDFLPSLLELLGQSPAPQCAGRSRAALFRGEDMPAENVFMEWSPNRVKVVKGTHVAGRRAVRQAVDESTRAIVSPDGWKLCLRDKDQNELYNLEADPIEAHNLFYTGQHRDIISRCTASIYDWQEQTRDRVRV